jgi:transcriptional regulator with XRE-family HTH domain
MSFNIAHRDMRGQDEYRYTGDPSSLDAMYPDGMADSGRQYFREWREFRELTQARAAERTPLSQGYLSDLERGVRRFNEEHLAMLSKAYNCEPWELIGRNPLIEPEPVASIWDRIPNDKRDAARQMLDALTDKKRA